jgi:hypothetical protein
MALALVVTGGAGLVYFYFISDTWSPWLAAAAGLLGYIGFGMSTSMRVPEPAVKGRATGTGRGCYGREASHPIGRLIGRALASDQRPETQTRVILPDDLKHLLLIPQSRSNEHVLP